MSYEIYKVIHLLSLLFVIFCLSVNYFSNTAQKWARIGGMVASLLLMVAGMGLLARTGAGWPAWVISKFVIWMVVAIGAPIMLKRLKGGRRKLGLLLTVLLLSVAVILAVMKP